MNPNTQDNFFPIRHLHVHTCCTYTRYSKTTGHIMFYHRKHLFCGSKHSWQFFPGKPFVHAYTHNLKTTCYLCMDVPGIDWLLWYRTHSLCGLELRDRSNWSATAPKTQESFSNTSLCAYTVSPYICSFRIENFDRFRTGQQSCPVPEPVNGSRTGCSEWET